MHESPGKWLIWRLMALGMALGVLGVASGCAGIQQWLHGKPKADTTAEAASDTGLNGYLKLMYDLSGGDPATQAEIYADTSTTARLAPGPVSKLRFALVLATPGHAGSDPEKAQDMLRALLSNQALLTPTERSLATVHLREVEQRLVLVAEARRLRSRNIREEQTEEAAAAERTRTIEAENRQLRQSLREAQKKLDAITSIEKSIREQTDSNNPP